ncbi:hypothetical protein PMSD_16320 [Paenibacillus macquariensis subsp. defensor]|nr:hypothetical protein PMSD_16320 [Paenibacillus macquariensis subsp. defensor]
MDFIGIRRGWERAMKKIILVSLAAITIIGGTVIPMKETVQAATIEKDAINDIKTKSANQTIVNDQNTTNVPTDPWGRVIRTTDLPKNYKDFPYILKDIPNEMYEMKPTDFGETSTTVEVVKLPGYSKEVVDKWVGYVEKYGNQLLNVDYETLNWNWMNDLTSVMNSDHRLTKDVLKYVSAAKKNKVKIQGSLTAEPSIVTIINGYVYIRVYFKFKVINYKNKNGDVFYDSWVKMSQINKNVEYEGYTDIGLSNRVINGSIKDYKVALLASLFYNATFKKVQ